MFCYFVFRFAAWLLTSAHAQFYLRNCKQQLPQQKTASLNKHPCVANCQPQPLCSSCQLDPSDEAPGAPMTRTSRSGFKSDELYLFWVMYVYGKNVHIVVCCGFSCRAAYFFLLKLIWVMWCLVHAAQPRPPSTFLKSQARVPEQRCWNPELSDSCPRYTSSF